MKKTQHHRKPRALQGGNEKSNISLVPDKQHKAFHLLFGAGNPYFIAKRLNEIWIDPAYKFIVVKR